jgi:hypothetical protein
LVYFPFGVDVDGAIFGAMVGFVAMVHAEQRSRCLLASASPPKLRHAGCARGIFGRKCLGFFPTKALCSSAANSLVAHDHQS